MLFTDHLGRNVEIPALPERIISLCPSQTSTLVALGLQDRLVGRTHFCIHPESVVKGIAAVGGTKNLKQARVEALRPDLVICEKEENTPEMVNWLAERFPVFVTEVRDLQGSRRMVQDLGKITGTEKAAQALAGEIAASMQRIVPIEGNPSVLYFIWRKPWMVAGEGTYIHVVLMELGFQNQGGGFSGRYPELPSTAIAASPDFVFLSSEPYPFDAKHFLEIEAMFPAAKVVLVDGEMFSWYGERQRDLAGYWDELKRKLRG